MASPVIVLIRLPQNFSADESAAIQPNQLLLYLPESAELIPELEKRLMEIFSQDNPPAALSLAIKPLSTDNKYRDLAASELAFLQSVLPRPFLGTAVFNRERLKTSTDTPVLIKNERDLRRAWFRLAMHNELLWHNPMLAVKIPLPHSFRLMWLWCERRAQSVIEDFKDGSVVYNSQKQEAAIMAGQCLLLPIIVLLWILPIPFDRSLTLSLAAVLLCYPLNRSYLKFISQRHPELLIQSMLYCLWRPLAWGWGIIKALLVKH